MAETTAPVGVEKLLSRLREDGVKAGRDEAERLVRKAEEEAARILADARRQVDGMRAAAKAGIEANDRAAKGALRLAGRDAMLALRNEVRGAFEQYVRRLVVQTTQDPGFVRSLVLVLAGEAVEKHVQDKEMQIHLSKAIFEGERTPEMRERGAAFLKGVASGVLRQGITLIPSDKVEGGARVRLVDDQVEIDLSDKAITDLLIRHMAPRFREIMTGEG